MSVLGRYKQQPGEKRKRGVDYTRFLEETEQLTAVTATVTPVTSPVFAATTIIIAADGKSFAYFAEGGVDQTDYTIEFRVTTNGGQILENEIEFEVEEI